jgi:hypothetical protein
MISTSLKSCRIDAVVLACIYFHHLPVFSYITAISLHYHHSHMVVHVLPNILHEARADDGDNTKDYGHIVDIFLRLISLETFCNSRKTHISFAERMLSRRNNGIVFGQVSIDSGQVKNLLVERVSNKSDNFNNLRLGRCISDCLKRTSFGSKETYLVVDLGNKHDGVTNEVCGSWHELVVKDIVINAEWELAEECIGQSRNSRISNGTTKDANGKRKSRDGGDEVIGADDSRDNRGRNHDTTDTETGNNENDPHLTKVLGGGRRESATASSHQNGGNDHEFTVGSLKDTKTDKDNTGTRQDGETDGNTADTDTDRVMSVDVESLGRPEHEDREEVGSRDEGDDQGQDQSSRSLVQAPGEHGKLGELGLPNAESDDEDNTDDERRDNVSRTPFILVTAPLHSAHEEKHADNGEESTDKINLLEDIHPAKASGVDTGWWEVEDGSKDESDECPHTAEQTNPSPSTW